jgi:hypothetical protein
MTGITGSQPPGWEREYTVLRVQSTSRSTRRILPHITIAVPPFLRGVGGIIRVEKHSLDGLILYDSYSVYPPSEVHP